MDEGKEKAIKKWNEIFFLRCAVASRGYTLCVENDQSPGRKVDLLFTEGQVGEDRFHIVLSGEDFFFPFLRRSYVQSTAGEIYIVYNSMDIFLNVAVDHPIGLIFFLFFFINVCIKPFFFYYLYTDDVNGSR